MRAYGPADSFYFGNTMEPSTLYFEDSVRTARDLGSLAVNRDDPHVSDRTGQIVTGYNEGSGKDHWSVHASGYKMESPQGAAQLMEPDGSEPWIYF